MRSRLGLGTLLRRQLLADRGVGVVVVAVVVIVSALVAAWPRLIDHIFTEDLHESVESAPARSRDLVSVLALRPPLMSDSEFRDPGGLSAGALYGEFSGALEAIRSSTPEPLQSSLRPAQYVLSGPEMAFGDREDYWPEEIRNGELTLTADPGYLDRIELTAGSAPGMDVDEVDPEELYGPPVDPADAGFEDVPIGQGVLYFAIPKGGLRAFEQSETVPLLTVDIVMTPATAEDFGWDVGEVRELWAGVRARLSGTFEPVNVADDYWVHHGSILSGHEFVDFDVGSTIIGQAYTDPVALAYVSRYESFVSFGNFPLTMRVWFPFDVSAHRVGMAQDILDSTRAFLANPQVVEDRRWTAEAQPGGLLTLRLSTSSTDVLERTVSAQNGAAALIAMVAAGPLGATIAVLALALRLLVERRRTALSLVGARGASVRQMRVVLALEGLLLGVPAAIAATYAVHRYVPGVGGLAGWVLPALIGVTPLVLLPLLVRPAGLAGQRRDLGRLRRGWLRWTADVLVVGTAGTALWLLNRRGLDTGVSASGVDPLLAATPLLLALAACVIVLRLYPIPVALLARAWRSRRTLVSYVGASRAVRDPAGGLAAVLALVVGLTVGVVSTVLWSTTQRGVEFAAESSVGADLRADGPAFTPEELAAVAALPGVDASTGVSDLGRIVLSGDDGRIDTVDVHVADLATLSQIQGGFADTVNIPDEALASGGSPVPVIASRGVGSAGFTGSLGYIRTFDVDIVASATSVPGVTRGDRWLLIDSNVLAEVVQSAASSRPRTLLVGTSGDADALLESMAAELPPQTQLKTQADASQEATGGAIGSGLRGAFATAAVVGGALAAAAVIITMVIAAPARGRLFSQLRTLGLSGWQARGLATWELAPLAVTAVVSGLLLGLAIPWLLLPSVDLRGLTGGSSQPGMSVDWTLVGGAVGAFVVVAILAMSVAVASSRRLRLGTVLRVGEEV